MQKFSNLVRVLFSVSIFGVSVSCSSYDLSKSKPVSTSVDTGNPTWRNGIGALITQKCVTCHTANRDNFVPGNTPSFMNKIGSEGFFTATNSYLLTRVEIRVFDSPDNPMPPSFGTPLTSDEKHALAMYLAGILNQ